MKNKSRVKRVLETIGLFLVTGAVTYGFLALCNWSPLMKDWTGFSRFILGIEGIIFLIILIDEI